MLVQRRKPVIPVAALSFGDSRRDLVMGVITNYEFAQVKPFLTSLLRTGYKGEIVLFHDRVDRPTLAAIAEYGVTLIRFRNLRGLFANGHGKRAIDRIAKAYHGYKWPFYKRLYWHLLAPAKLRYLLYHRHLQWFGSRYRHVLLTDVRDVVFQANPFGERLTEDIAFFEESHAVGRIGWNADWLRRHLGEDALERLASRTTLCSGTTMGKPEALCWYLGRYLDLLRSAKRQDLRTGDQALHNALVREHFREFPFSARIYANGEGPVVTLTQYLVTERIARSTEGKVIGRNGSPVPVVHQYDRHPELVPALLGLFVD